MISPLQSLFARICLLFVCGVAAACGPVSLAEMEAKWHTNEENAQKYEAKYPATKSALADFITSAKKDFDAAKSTGDVKTRGERLSTINERVASSLRGFESYETELDKLQKLMKDKTLNDLPASKFNPANEAAKDAVSRSHALLFDAHPANMGEVKGKLEDAVKAIRDASAGLEALRPAKPAGGGNASSPPGPASSPAPKKK